MSLDPGIQVALCSGLEILVNKALTFDPASRLALARQQGRVLAIEVTRPAILLYVIPDENGLRLQTTFDGEVTTRLKGSAVALMSLVNGSQVNLAGSGIEVLGSTSFLIDLQSLLQQLDIDWEEAVSTVIGDIAGHQIGNQVRGMKQWLGERKQSFERLLGEFLTEEIQATPNRIELEDFYQQVDELRLAVDRASAQVQQLIKPHSDKEG